MIGGPIGRRGSYGADMVDSQGPAKSLAVLAAALCPLEDEPADRSGDSHSQATVGARMTVASRPRVVGPPRRSRLVPARPSRRARRGSAARRPPASREVPLVARAGLPAIRQ